MYHCRELLSFVVGMLVILITPPGVEHGLAALEEVFGSLPAPRTFPLAFFTPSMFLTLVFSALSETNSLSDCLAAFTSSNPPTATAGKMKRTRYSDYEMDSWQ